MAIKFHCPTCGEDYEMDNAVGGKSASCVCGATFKIPTAPAAEGDFNACPGCGQVVPAESVICVGCGHNFKTGKKAEAEAGPAADEEAEGAGPDGPKVPFMEKYGDWVKLGAKVVAVLVIGYFGYVYFTAKHYGITGKRPMGTFKKLDKHLADMGLKKASETKALAKGFGAEGTLYYYNDEFLAQKTRGMINESVFVGVDKGGEVCAVGAVFYPPDGSIPGAGTKVGRFMEQYWNEIPCPAPEFKETRHEDGFLKWVENVADVKTEAVAGHWFKTDPPTALYASSDRARVVRAGLEGKVLDPSNALIADDAKEDTGK